MKVDVLFLQLLRTPFGWVLLASSEEDGSIAYDLDAPVTPEWLAQLAISECRALGLNHVAHDHADYWALSAFTSTLEAAGIQLRKWQPGHSRANGNVPVVAF